MNRATLIRWWQNLAPRERAVLGLGALVLVGVLGYLLLWEPPAAGIRKLQGDLPQLRSQDAAMRAMSDEAAALRAAGGATAVIAPADRVAAVRRSLQRAGLLREGAGLAAPAATPEVERAPAGTVSTLSVGGAVTTVSSAAATPTSPPDVAADGTERVRVRFDNIDYGVWVAWLAAGEGELSARASRVTVVALAPKAPVGHVRAEVVLELESVAGSGPAVVSAVGRSAGAGRAVVAGTAVVAVLCVVGVLIATAPANWLAILLAARTHGVVLLADADGTVWSGSAVLGLGTPLVEGGDGSDPGPGPADVRRLALPGRVTWTLEITRALAPVLHLKHDGVLLQPLAVRYRDGGLTLDDGAIALPAAMLQLAGAPLNTLLPDGRAQLQWSGLRFEAGGLPSGEGTLRIADFSLALSPVKPLGDYLVSWTSGPTGLSWRLGTERGPLELEGNGSLAGRRGQLRIAVRVARDAPAATVPQLNALLDLIGRRGTSEAVIESGLR